MCRLVVDDLHCLGVLRGESCQVGGPLHRTPHHDVVLGSHLVRVGVGVRVRVRVRVRVTVRVRVRVRLRVRVRVSVRVGTLKR